MREAGNRAIWMGLRAVDCLPSRWHSGRPEAGRFSHVSGELFILGEYSHEEVHVVSLAADRGAGPREKRQRSGR